MKIYLKSRFRKNPYAPGTRQFNTLEDIKEVMAINNTTTLEKLIQENKETVTDCDGNTSEEIAREYYAHPDSIAALKADKLITVRNT